MLVGCPPFYTSSQNTEKMYNMIKKREISFPDPERYKIYMSDDCKDFIKQLLMKDPAKRLGTNGGLNEVLAHPWFKSLDAAKVAAKKEKAPFIPKLSNRIDDISNFDDEFTSEEAVITMLDREQQRQVEKAKQQFKGF